MRIVVYPHVLEIGGSQLNAVELAGAVRDLGHEVIVFGHPGPLQGRIAELGLEFVAAPPVGRRPSPGVMRGLCEVVRHRKIEIVHGYEWTAGLESYLGPRARLGVPAVCTVMSMAVAPFLPSDLPLVVGTEQIAAYEKSIGRRRVTVIEPPVDVVHNAPGICGDLTGFRRRYGLTSDALTLVSVTRLAAELKLEGLLTAIDAIAEVSRRTRIRLVVVGDGPARELVERRACAANARAGYDAVVLTGQLDDPRPAYAAADICLAMGGSALRAMAFARPLVVQGEHGFWESLTPQTCEQFLWTGWYGIGASAADGHQRLVDVLIPLLDDATLRKRLGDYARSLAVDRFALGRASAVQLEVYERALAAAPVCRRQWLGPAAVGTMGFARYKARQRWQRWSGSARSDDFNARPVAATMAGTRPATASASKELT